MSTYKCALQSCKQKWIQRICTPIRNLWVKMDNEPKEHCVLLYQVAKETEEDMLQTSNLTLLHWFPIKNWLETSLVGLVSFYMTAIANHSLQQTPRRICWWKLKGLYGNWRDWFWNIWGLIVSSLVYSRFFY